MLSLESFPIFFIDKLLITFYSYLCSVYQNNVVIYYQPTLPLVSKLANPSVMITRLMGSLRGSIPENSASCWTAEVQKICYLHIALNQRLLFPFGIERFCARTHHSTMYKQAPYAFNVIFSLTDVKNTKTFHNFIY